MKLSTKSRYGTRMLLFMAQNYNRPVQIKEISEAEEITPKYVEQLAMLLKKAGFIKSVRGPKGGYVLSKPPERITIKDVVSVLEKESVLVRCVKDPESCHRSKTCKTRHIWKRATQLLLDNLSTVTLKDLIQS